MVIPCGVRSRPLETEPFGIKGVSNVQARLCSQVSALSGQLLLPAKQFQHLQVLIGEVHGTMLSPQQDLFPKGQETVSVHFLSDETHKKNIWTHLNPNETY